MKTKNRILQISDEQLKEALMSFASAHEENKKFNSDALKKGNEEDGIPNVIEVVKTIEDFAGILMNNGFSVEDQKYIDIDELNSKMEDFANEMKNAGIIRDFGVGELGFVVQQTITRLVSMMERPEIEAWMLVSRELIIKPGNQIYNVMIGVDGHATARIPEGGEYNTFKLESTEEYIKTSGGKVGIMASYSEEALRRAGAQAIKMLADAALNDMKRFKSIEAIHILEANARNFYDGLDTAETHAKMPSGRSLQDPKKKNGTLLMRDLETFFCETQANGFNVDTIFLNPLAYKIFLYEPSIRKYLKETANVVFIVPKKRNTITQNLVTKLMKKTSGTEKAAEGMDIVVPNLIKNKSLNIIVTPIVKVHAKGDKINTPATRYTAAPQQWHASAPNNCADILLIDSSRALTYVHDGRGVISDTVEDRLRDITRIKFKTYYHFLLDKDHGVFAFRNINITEDVFDPYQNINVVMNHSELFPAE